MGYDIYNRAGEYHRLNIDGMGKVRKVLERAGVEARDQLIYNEGQHVGAEDCQMIAEALEAVTIEEIAVAVETFEPDPVIREIDELLSVTTGARVVTPSPSNQETLEACRSFAEFCRSSADHGGFSVH